MLAGTVRQAGNEKSLSSSSSLTSGCCAVLQPCYTVQYATYVLLYTHGSVVTGEETFLAVSNSSSIYFPNFSLSRDGRRVVKAS